MSARQITVSRKAVLLFVGIVVSYLALMAAPLANPIVDKVVGPPKFIQREVLPEEERRATTVQLITVGCVFLLLSFGYSKIFLTRSHSVAFWFANPASIAAGVFLFSHLLPDIFPFPTLSDEFAIRVRAFFAPQGDQLRELYVGAVLVCFLLSWLGAWIGSHRIALKSQP